MMTQIASWKQTQNKKLEPVFNTKAYICKYNFVKEENQSPYLIWKLTYVALI